MLPSQLPSAAHMKKDTSVKNKAKQFGWSCPHAAVGVPCSTSTTTTKKLLKSCIVKYHPDTKGKEAHQDKYNVCVEYRELLDKKPTAEEIGCNERKRQDQSKKEMDEIRKIISDIPTSQATSEETTPQATSAQTYGYALVQGVNAYGQPTWVYVPAIVPQPPQHQIQPTPRAAVSQPPHPSPVPTPVPTTARNDDKKRKQSKKAPLQCKQQRVIDTSPQQMTPFQIADVLKELYQSGGSRNHYIKKLQEALEGKNEYHPNFPRPQDDNFCNKLLCYRIPSGKDPNGNDRDGRDGHLRAPLLKIQKNAKVLIKYWNE